MKYFQKSSLRDFQFFPTELLLYPILAAEQFISDITEDTPPNNPHLHNIYGFHIRHSEGQCAVKSKCGILFGLEKTFNRY